jgi:hypothetical protein
MTSNIDSKSSLHDKFEEMGEKVNDINYRHPHEGELLKKLEEVLNGTNTGKRLVESIKNFEIPIRLIKGQDLYGFSIEGKAVYVSLPHNKTETSPRLVLELVAALRSAEQDLMGYGDPSDDIEPLEYAAMHHAKNLDLVVHMCRVAYEEKNKTNNNDYIDALEEMGHGGLYDAYSRDFAPNDLVDVYYGSEE